MIVVNTTFIQAEWADVLYAMDRKWWAEYISRVTREFKGILTTAQSSINGVNRVQFTHYLNSGAGAIALAEHWGAKKIILLGYDCQKTDGKAHWHGDHPKTLGNAGSIDKWPLQFQKLHNDFKNKTHVEIINCSRETKLTMFPRMSLEEALK